MRSKEDCWVRLYICALWVDSTYVLLLYNMYTKIHKNKIKTSIKPKFNKSSHLTQTFEEKNINYKYEPNKPRTCRNIILITVYLIVLEPPGSQILYETEIFLQSTIIWVMMMQDTSLLNMVITNIYHIHSIFHVCSVLFFPAILGVEIPHFGVD